MGNTIGSQGLEDLRLYLVDSPDIVVHSLLATYKLFKVFHCAHEGFRHGGVIVKLFIPNENEEDDHIDLRMESILKPYRDATFLIQCRFSGAIHPNVVPYETAEILNKSAILVRQYFGRNLYDRLYSQPHLLEVHKQWISLQLLMSLAQLHSVGVIHGDIKSENAFLIGSFHLVLTDFSTFIKPVYLPLHDPVAATSMFFESGVKRRRCFVAPERFNGKLTSRVLDEHGRRMTFFDKMFTTEFVKMDLFSVGLTIAELWLGGQHVVDLPELLSAREGGGGQFDLTKSMERITDPVWQAIVKDLTRIAPHQRPDSAVHVLDSLWDVLCPGFWDLMVPLLFLSSHPMYQSSPDLRFMLIERNWGYIQQVLIGAPEELATDPPISTDPLPTYDSFTEMDIVGQAFSTSLLGRGVAFSIQPLVSWSSQCHSSNSLFPHPKLSYSSCRAFSRGLLELWKTGSHAHLQKGTEGDTWRESMGSRVNELYNVFFLDKTDAKNIPPDAKNITLIPLFVSFLGSTVGAASCEKSKMVYLEIVSVLARKCESDACIADFMIPYVYELCLGSTGGRRLAVKAMDCLVTLVNQLTTPETGLFSEYLFPLCLTLLAGGKTSSPEISSSAIRLSSCLAGQAMTLSNGDAQKVVAIRMFLDRVVETALAKGLQEGLAVNVEIFALWGRNACTKKLNDFIHYVRHSGNGRVKSMLCQNLHKILPSLGDPKNDVENLIVPFFLDSLAEEDDCIRETIVRGLMGVLRKGACISLSPSQCYAKIFLALQALLAKNCASIFLKDLIVNDLIVDVIGSQMSPVDQFVFLRQSTGGYRSVLEWAVQYWRSCKPVVPETSSKPPVDIFENPVPIRKFSVPVVNPSSGSPLAPQVLSQVDEIFFASHTGSLSQYKVWRIPAAGYPTHVLPDLGCLSKDGSLLNLYSGTGAMGTIGLATGATGTPSLHRRYLSTLPGVPSHVETGTASLSDKCSDKSLLASLNDFCVGGFAVPVVSLTSTDDGRLIVAGGADGTVRVWRVSALETESVMQSSYGFKVSPSVMGSRLFKIKSLRNCKSIVVGSDDRLLVYRLDVMTGGVMNSPSSAGVMTASVMSYDSGVGSRSGEHPACKTGTACVASPKHACGPVVAMETFDCEFSANVMAACENGYILNWDMRMKSFAWQYCIQSAGVTVQPVNGLLVYDKGAMNKFAVSFRNGQISTFDMRFLRPVHSWCIENSLGISAIANSSTGNSNIWAATGEFIWLLDIDNGGPTSYVLSSNNTAMWERSAARVPVDAHTIPGLRQWNWSSAPEWNIPKILKTDAESTNARAVLECAGNPWTVFSGHNDGFAREWSNDGPTGIIGPPSNDSINKWERLSDSWISQTMRTVDGLDASGSTYRACSVMENHRDVITDVCLASLQYDIVVTAGRDGYVKLWK